MSEIHEKLLEPTLSLGDRVRPIYSVRAGFLLAFVGGPVAITIFSALNSNRLGRFARDAVYYGAAILVVIALVYVHGKFPSLFGGGGGGADGSTSADYFRYVLRFAGLGFFGVFYLMHRKQYRAMAVSGVEHPSPWLPAIACAVAGIGATALIIILFGRRSGV